MSAGTDVPTPRAASTLFGDLEKNWGWLLAFGILSVILGLIGLGGVVGLSIVSVYFIGTLILVDGVLQLVEAFKCRGWKSVLWHVLIALLYVFAGGVILRRPLFAMVTFTAMIGIAILVAGIFRVVMALQLRGIRGWGWTLFGGVVSILLGAMILSRWPESGLWIIGLFVAIELIANGWSSIFIALAAREAGRAAPAPAET